MQYSAVLLAAAISATSAFAGESDRVNLRFEMDAVMGLHVLTMYETFSESADGYAIGMVLKSRGLADLLSRIDSRTEVKGRIIQGQAYSQSFYSDVRRDGREVVFDTAYSLDGVLSHGRTPDAAEARTPVTPQMLRGVVDEHTAYYRLERQLARSGSCALAVPVFDGLHRFDLVFADASSPASGGPRLPDPTRECEVTRHKIGGFLTDGSREGLEHGRMWFAHLLPGTMLPVKMEFDTEIGVVTGTLSEMHGRGADFAQSE